MKKENSVSINAAVVSEFVISKFEMDNNIPIVMMSYYNPHLDNDFRQMIESDKVIGNVIETGDNSITICKEELTSDDFTFFCDLNIEQKKDGFSISVKWKVLDLTSRTTLKKSINSFSLKDEDWELSSYLVKMRTVDINLAPVFSVYRLNHKATLDPSRSRPIIATNIGDRIMKGYKKKIRLSIGTMISLSEIKVDNYDVKLEGRRYTTSTLVSSKTANVEELK